MSVDESYEYMVHGRADKNATCETHIHPIQSMPPSLSSFITNLSIRFSGGTPGIRLDEDR